MLRFLRWLFTGDGHKHKWKRVDELKCSDFDTGRVKSRVYVQECEICGKMDHYRIGKS